MAIYHAKDVLENPDASATVLHAIVLKKYGEAWYMWDPSTVALELKSDFYAEVPAENMDKLSAVQVLVSTDSFFTDPSAFFGICSTFADGDPAFNVFDPPSMAEIAWTVAEVAINRELLPFARAIKKAVEAL